MKLESQVVSLELAKKLKELGVKQESLFYWLSPVEGGGASLWYKTEVGAYNSIGAGLGEGTWINAIKCSAYNVAELDEWLMRTDYAVIAQHDGHWVFRRKPETTLEYGMIGGHGMGPMKNPADRRADLLIYLIEQGLVDVTTLKV